MRFKNDETPAKARLCTYTKPTNKDDVDRLFELSGDAHFIRVSDIDWSTVSSGGATWSRNDPQRVWRQDGKEWYTSTRESYERRGYDLSPLFEAEDFATFTQKVMDYVSSAERSVSVKEMVGWLNQSGFFKALTLAEAQDAVEDVLTHHGCPSGAEKARIAVGLKVEPVREWTTRDITAKEADEIIRSIDGRQVSIGENRIAVSVGSRHHERIVAAAELASNGVEVQLKHVGVYE